MNEQNMVEAVDTYTTKHAEPGKVCFVVDSSVLAQHWQPNHRKMSKSRRSFTAVLKSARN